MRLGLGVTLLVSFLSPALAADPPPPEIQVIFEKMRNHQPVSPEEIQAIQVWTMRKANGTDAHPNQTPTVDENPDMPPDVQQIMARAMAGQKPSAAEEARLKSWAADTKSRKAAIKKDGDATIDLLKQVTAPSLGARRPGPPPKPLNGTIALDVTQNVKGDDGNVTYHAKVSLPITYRIRDEKNGIPALHFSWQQDPTRTVSIDYTLKGTARHDPHREDCPAHDDQLGGNVNWSGAGKTVFLIGSGQIVVPKGRRAYADVSLMSAARGPYSVTCPCGGGHSEAPPTLLPLTWDRLRGDVPFDFGMGDTPTIATPLIDKMPADARGMLDGASFDFDAGRLRAAIAKGGQFQTNATYHWKSNVKGVTSDSRTLLTISVELAVPQNGIVVAPDPPKRGDQVHVEAHVQGATRYHWTLTPKACADETVPPAFESDAPTLDFVALCDFTAKVKPYNQDGDLDPPPDKEVSVGARTWKVDRISHGDSYFNHPLMMAAQNVNEDELQPDGDLHLGENACNVDESEGFVENRHWIHHPHGTTEYEHPKAEGGFVVATASSGPWHGYAYIKEQGLKLDRVHLINSDLKAGSALWRLNVTAAAQVKTKKPDIQAFADSLRAHEQAHGDLAEEKLAGVDPAPKIEKMIRSDDRTLARDANAQIGDADTDITNAANHAHVKARMKNQGWNRSGYVLLPDPTGYRTFVIGDYSELGATPP
jgi:hypothetical protein